MHKALQLYYRSAVSPVTEEIGNDGHCHCGWLNVNEWAHTESAVLLWLYLSPDGIEDERLPPCIMENSNEWQGRGRKGRRMREKWEDRWNNGGEWIDVGEERKKNMGVDENRVGRTKGSSSFKMTFLRYWLWGHKNPVKRAFSNMSHPINASKIVRLRFQKRYSTFANKQKVVAQG